GTQRQRLLENPVRLFWTGSISCCGIYGSRQLVYFDYGWAKHPEKVKNKKPSAEKLAKIDQMLAELDQQ
ncbi:hypothetical protein NE645_19180, partial [Roseburia hominis]|nr:hypothetical protein [Roseburia hominis]